MTKHVRIENADTSDFKVVVETWDTNADGEQSMSESQSLDNPTAMADVWITDTRFIVIRESK